MMPCSCTGRSVPPLRCRRSAINLPWLREGPVPAMTRKGYGVDTAVLIFVAVLVVAACEGRATGLSAPYQV